MPILEVAHAEAVVFSKRSMRPGFAGIENELLYDAKTTLLFGDSAHRLTAANLGDRQLPARRFEVPLPVLGRAGLFGFGPADMVSGPGMVLVDSGGVTRTVSHVRVGVGAAPRTSWCSTRSPVRCLRRRWRSRSRRLRMTEVD